MIVNKGTLYWITGLSGSGKTTIAKVLYKHIKLKYSNTIILDGDVLREVLGCKEISYDKKSRKSLAMQYSKLSKLFTDQGINVVFATISMFEEVRVWNRANISNYIEIYLKVSINKILERDKNQLFSKALRKEEKNVVGVDIIIEEPKNPDIVLENNMHESISNLAKDLIQKISLINLK
jgi:adenylylsulfate kinase-like enzyme